MPLIIKGGKEPKVVSKKEMKDLLKSIENDSTEEVLKKLSPEVAERRRETLINKAARENAVLIAEAQAEAEKLKKEKEKEQIQIAVKEKVKDAVVETVAPITVDTNSSVSVIIDTKENEVSKENSIPDFTKMTKKEIDVWADENLGVQLDRRNTKDRMIADLKPHL
jgi:hypothetical protein